MKCPKCGSENIRKCRKYCSHTAICRDCGYWWCYYYSGMSRKERLLRKKFFLDHGGVEKEGARYLWTGIDEKEG